MREIKLRAWDCERNKMAKVTWFGFNDGELTLEDEECSTWQAVYGYTAKVMQYTGLKDKNGKEIYEGDIVRLYTPYYNENNKVKLEYKVFYFEEGAFFQLENIKDKNDLDTFCGYSNKQFEVIGNIYIYENPELLKGR